MPRPHRLDAQSEAAASPDEVPPLMVGPDIFVAEKKPLSGTTFQEFTMLRSVVRNMLVGGLFQRLAFIHIGSPSHPHLRHGVVSQVAQNSVHFYVSHLVRHCSQPCSFYVMGSEVNADRFLRRSLHSSSLDSASRRFKVRSPM